MMSSAVAEVPAITSYEAHITIEPVFGQRFKDFEEICAIHKFRPRRTPVNEVLAAGNPAA